MQENEKEGNEEEKPNVTLKITASAFPMRLFKEWDEDCKKRFGDCRWMKMWNDHLASKSAEMYIEMNKRISELKSEIDSLKKKKSEPETEEPPVLNKRENKEKEVEKE